MAGDKGGSGKKREVGGLVFVGCIVIGMGVSFALNNMPVGLFIGLGAGFIAMAIIRFKSGNTRED